MQVKKNLFSLVNQNVCSTLCNRKINIPACLCWRSVSKSVWESYALFARSFRFFIVVWTSMLNSDGSRPGTWRFGHLLLLSLIPNNPTRTPTFIFILYPIKNMLQLSFPFFFGWLVIIKGSTEFGPFFWVIVIS